VLLTALRDTKHGKRFSEDLSKAGSHNENVFHNKTWQPVVVSTVKALMKLKAEKYRSKGQLPIGLGVLFGDRKAIHPAPYAQVGFPRRKFLFAMCLLDNFPTRATA
jgi:hypothetical protein